MDTLLQMQIFFFISSMGFILLWILIAVFLFYLIRVADTFSKIMEKIEKDIDNIGDTTKEMLEDVRDSTFFNFLLGKKRRKHYEKK
jgi:hypothetical protein